MAISQKELGLLTIASIYDNAIALHSTLDHPKVIKLESTLSDRSIAYKADLVAISTEQEWLKSVTIKSL